MDNASPLQRLRDFDNNRAGIPGEHLFALALGILLIFAARRRSPLVRSIATAAGTSLIARAASGRDGVRKWL